VTPLTAEGFPLFSIEGAASQPPNGTNVVVDLSTFTLTDITMTGLSVTPNPVTVTAGTATGNTQQLTVTATFSDGETVVFPASALDDVTFTPDNSGHFTVSSTGLVTAGTAGSGSITASYTSEGTVVTSSAVTVNVTGGVTGTSFVVSPDPLEAGIGGTTAPVTATFTEPGEESRVITNDHVTYSFNSDAAGFTANADGSVTVADSVTPGTTATLTATWTNPETEEVFTDTITVTAVNARVFSQPTADTLELPQDFGYQTRVTDNGTVVESPGADGYTFESSNPGIANITSTGVLTTGDDNGTATISLLYQGEEVDSFSLTVADVDITAIDVTPATFNLTPGQVQTYSVLATYDDGHSGDIAGSPFLETIRESDGTGANDTLFYLGRAIGGRDFGNATYTFSVGEVSDNVTVNQAFGFVTDYQVTVGGLSSGKIPVDLEGIVDVFATLTSGETVRLRPDQFELDNVTDDNFGCDGNIIDSSETSIGDTDEFEVTLNPEQFAPASSSVNFTRTFTVTSVSHDDGRASVQFTNYSDDPVIFDYVARPITMLFSNGEVTNFKTSDRNTSVYNSTAAVSIDTDSDIWGFPLLVSDNDGPFEGTITLDVRTDQWNDFIASATLPIDIYYAGDGGARAVGVNASDIEDPFSGYFHFVASSLVLHPGETQTTDLEVTAYDASDAAHTFIRTLDFAYPSFAVGGGIQPVSLLPQGTLWARTNGTSLAVTAIGVDQSLSVTAFSKSTDGLQELCDLAVSITDSPFFFPPP
jgi:hypothetical protein